MDALLKISIAYCIVWHYTDRAVGLANELLQNLEPEIESITLIPSDGGRYEITVNDKLVYSKLRTGRHTFTGEVMELVKEFLKK